MMNPVATYLPIKHYKFTIGSMVGVQRYLDIGVPADRLVLGVPWYGYNYTCLSLSEVCRFRKRITVNILNIRIAIPEQTV